MNSKLGVGIQGEREKFVSYWQRVIGDKLALQGITRTTEEISFVLAEAVIEPIYDDMLIRQGELTAVAKQEAIEFALKMIEGRLRELSGGSDTVAYEFGVLKKRIENPGLAQEAKFTGSAFREQPKRFDETVKDTPTVMVAYMSLRTLRDLARTLAEYALFSWWNWLKGYRPARSGDTYDIGFPEGKKLTIMIMNEKQMAERWLAQRGITDVKVSENGEIKF